MKQTPLLRYENMPDAAQGFLDPGRLADDRAAELTLHACEFCGLVQIPGPPVSYYREVIRASAYSPAMKEFRRAQFADWVADHELRDKPVLEVGCGRGEYLALLNEAGVAAHGIEYSAAAVAACRQAGLSANKAFLGRAGQRLRHADAPFAAFVTLNFMEHWPDPVASLNAIRGNLADDAVGLIEVPNFDMILEHGLYAEFIRDHLSYFTQASLRHTLQAAGFEILHCRSIWHDYILSATVRKRPAADLSVIHTHRTRIRDALESFLQRFPPRDVAAWGAGHQALATIALAGIAGRLRYVVDSAPFKQGKYTPATHLPIVPPSALDSDPVQAVIVMAAGYSDEVAGRLRSTYGTRLPVAVLRDAGLEILPADAASGLSAMSTDGRSGE